MISLSSVHSDGIFQTVFMLFQSIFYRGVEMMISIRCTITRRQNPFTAIINENDAIKFKWVACRKLLFIHNITQQHFILSFIVCDLTRNDEWMNFLKRQYLVYNSLNRSFINSFIRSFIPYLLNVNVELFDSHCT